MVGSIRDNCGIALAHSLEDAYELAKHQNHRGQDTAGIGYMSPHNDIYTIRWHGKVPAFQTRDLVGLIDDFGEGGIDGMYVSHTKYTTSGARDPLSILRASHPHYLGDVEEDYNGSHLVTIGPKKILVHNGQIVNEETFRKSLNGHNFLTDCDTETLLAYADAHGVRKALEDIPTAYCAILMDSEIHSATAFRDRYGIRPMWLGEKRGKALISSEDYALREIGATPIQEVPPGSMVTIDSDGIPYIEQIINPEPHPCIFEYIYILHPESTFYGIKVKDFQVELGRQLLREFSSELPKDAVVTHVPHRPEIAARAFAAEGGFQYKPIFYKMSDERAFYGLHQEDRESSIRRNMYLNSRHKNQIKGRDIIIIDDSIVRATNSQYAVELARNAGARRVYFLSTAPMIGGEVPLLTDLQLSGNGTDHYLSALGKKEDVCAACFSGREPIPLNMLSAREIAEIGNGKRLAGCSYGVAMPNSDTFVTVRAGRNLEGIKKEIGSDFLGYTSENGLSEIHEKLTEKVAA